MKTFKSYTLRSIFFMTSLCLCYLIQAQPTIAYNTEIFECIFVADETAQFDCSFNGTLSLEIIDPDNVLTVFNYTEVTDGIFSFKYQLLAVAPENIQLVWTILTSDDVIGCAVPETVINSTINTDCLCFPSTNDHSTHETCFGCNDGTADIEVSGMIAPITFEWENGGTSSYQENLAPGNYNMTITGANDIACTAGHVLIILPYECAVTEIEYEVTHINCHSDCQGTIDILGLLNGDEFQDVLWMDGSTELYREDLCAGLYSLNIVKEDNCPYYAEIIIEEPEILELEVKEIIHADGPETGSIIIAADGGVAPYSFFINLDGESIEHDSSESEINNLDPGCYELMVVDINGCAAVQDSVCIDNLSSIQSILNSGFSVYPNPVGAYLKVNFDDNYEVLEINIFNILGEKLSLNFDDSQIQVDHLNEGIYIIDIVTDQGHWIQQFVKNNAF